MDIFLTFKTPDVEHYALQDIMDEEKQDEAKAAIKKWVRHGELITVKIDTVAGTCTPLEVKP